MADGTWDISEILQFDVKDNPRGNLYYDVDCLTVDQISHLTQIKLDTIRNDQKYLHNHPEIRAIIFLIIKYILKIRPRNDLHGVIGDYFQRSYENISKEIESYLKRTNKKIVVEEEEIKEDLELEIEKYLNYISLKEIEETEEHLEAFEEVETEISSESVGIVKKLLNEIIENSTCN